MLAGAKKYDLDLSRMADEALVILAQECAFRPATDELLLRCYERMNLLVALKAKRLWLAADLPDAQQNAVFAILEAIAGYNTLEAAKPRGCRFRTYLRRVVLARFGDFVRQVRRLQRRCCRLQEAGERLAAGRGRFLAVQRYAGRNILESQGVTEILPKWRLVVSPLSVKSLRQA
jgi:hypothetical protein